MGTGGPPSHRRRIQLVQIPICFVVGTRRSLRLRLRAFRLAYENLLCAVYVKDCSLKTKQEKKSGILDRKVLRTLRNAD